MSSVAGPEADPVQAPTCSNPGNPVFSCMISANNRTPGAAPAPWFRTTSSQYGAARPTWGCFPCSHHPQTRTFSRHLARCGMYRDHSFNTCLDRSRVHDCPHGQHTL
ncbi:hypothetical protein N1851_020208 [Merluccius polli]|uniref:Uncharacterized protein n=1 Tax=Merluccius polli TaxID=89951 RepID=A0AA47NX73_MERPO|nr:hypothetical protein N1851_026495 [Merluccius polli]KAK0142111.1 hypothetical protein N1851_020208 [Merluccius polli]